MKSKIKSKFQLCFSCQRFKERRRKHERRYMLRRQDICPIRTVLCQTVTRVIIHSWEIFVYRKKNRWTWRSFFKEHHRRLAFVQQSLRRASIYLFKNESRFSIVDAWRSARKSCPWFYRVHIVITYCSTTGQRSDVWEIGIFCSVCL